MKIIYQRISALLFGAFMLFIISCNKSIYPPTSSVATTSQQENSLSAITEFNPGNSPSGLSQSETFNAEIAADSTPTPSIEKNVVPENSNEQIPIIKSLKDAPVYVVEDDEYPSQRDVNEALFVAILGLLLLPTGISLIFSALSLGMSKKLQRKIEADPKLAIYSKKTKVAKILSIIGIALYVALVILIIIAIFSFFNYLENDFTLFGL
ncbi:MAG TPA: hypothetical protein PLJ00_01700 [Chitinophagales bacterium]|nr:hypothetical protein [Chitinophagales bacterium]HRG26574.1 hypothetical protein [Chitinophagales bacterium]HRG84767.1 hypothetical protein [Chitinophagales bacterium]HRH52256.1 hypothetical protein [Chitinophagales bacterium]